MIKGTKNSILNIAECISDGKYIKIKPGDLDIKNERIAYCCELPFGIISFFTLINIETMNIISSDIEINNSNNPNNPNCLLYCFLNN